MSDSDCRQHTSRRFNPLLREWVIVCRNRLNRPWKGATESAKAPSATTTATATHQTQASSTTQNYLAPGGVRANGVQMPLYTGTFVFDNDFPIFDGAESQESREPVDEFGDGLFVSQKTKGTSRVICYHPDPTKRFVNMSPAEIEAVFYTFQQQMTELQSKFDWVQIFENKGAAVGCSNPHPHCQLWASDFVPTNVVKRDESQREYFAKHGRPLLLDYIGKELEKRERVVLRNEHWTVVVPFWAYWPFETLLVPTRHVLRFNDLTPTEVSALAHISKDLLTRYDNVFECDFPFIMGWQGAPTGRLLGQDCSHWQLHAIYYPPLVRSASVRKFMAGYEAICEPQRDFSPEEAAERLRSTPPTHFSLRH